MQHLKYFAIIVLFAHFTFCNRSNFIELRCEFKAYGLSRYDCVIDRLNATESNLNISAIVGRHLLGMTNNDVNFLLGTHQSSPYLPNGISELFPNLFDFSYTGTSLKYIERDNFSGLWKLRLLRISFNQIAEIPQDTFYDLINLEDLWIDNNKIKTLQRNTFSNLKNLQNLYASNNKLEHLDRDLFRNNWHMTEISFYNNKLKSIDIDFRQMKNIQYVNLGENECTDKRYGGFGANIRTLQQLQYDINENCKKTIFFARLVNVGF